MTRIALVELGAVGVFALLELIGEGKNSEQQLELVLADRRPLHPYMLAHAAEQLPGLGAFAGRPRADALVELLAARVAEQPGLSLRATGGPEFGRGWQASCLADCDLCLIPSDLAVEARVFAAHEAAFSAGVASLAALACGRTGWLGPRSLPGAGACLRCAVARITATTGSSPFTTPELPDPSCCERLGLALAREAMALVARAGSPTTIGALRYLGEGVDVRHAVLRTGACPGCASGGPFMPYRFARAAALDEPSRGPRHILELAPSLVSPLTGPVRTIQPTKAPAYARVPQLEHWWAEARDPSLGGERRGASGCSSSREVAQAAALGEAVERLASGRPRDGDLFWASYAELREEGLAAVDSAAWDLFHPRTRAQEGFPYAPHDASRVEGWVWGVSLPQNRPTALPAERVFALPGVEHPVDTAIVSGFATGTCYAEAAERGLREVLERDAFMAAWHARLPTRRVLLPEGDACFGPMLEAFTACELEVRLASVRLDHGMELVIGLARSERPGEASMSISASLDFDLHDAAHGALRELVTSRYLAASLVREAVGHFPQAEPAQLRRMGDHGLLYARPEQREALDPWWEGVGVRELAARKEAQPMSARARLERVLAALAQLELRVFTVDLTPPELAQLGLCVVKALVPGTSPMQFDSRFPHLGGARLAALPQRLGLRATPLSFEDFRHDPHPFP